MKSVTKSAHHRAAKPFGALAAACALWLVAVWSPPGAGQTSGGATYNETDLMKSQPFDRLMLIDGTKVIVEPVSPRPLPPMVRAKEKKSVLDDATTDRIGPPKEGNVGTEAAKKKDADPILREINIQRLDGEPGAFSVRRIHIKSIEYFEDLLLAEADRLIGARDYFKAFEHLQLVRERNPKWRGLEEGFQKLIYEEGNAALLDRDIDRAQRLLRDLHARKPDYPGLSGLLASAYGGRIERAVKSEAFREGRRVLHDLEVFAPQHPLVAETKARYLELAKSHLEKAAKASGTTKLDEAAEALRIWPNLDPAAPVYEAAFVAVPTLDVAVCDVPRQIGPWVRSPAEERGTRLVYLPLLARDDEDAARGRVRDQLAAELLSTDLGRRITVQLKRGPAWSDGSRPVSAIDVVRSLSDRAQPSSPAFNARWADLLERIEALDETQVVLRLTRAPLKAESWMLGPIGPAHASRDGQAPTSEGSRRPLGDGPFVWDPNADVGATFRAAWQAGAPGAPKIVRVREFRLPSAKAAVGALLRGEVTMLEHVPQDRLADLAREPEIKIGRLKQPDIHRIAIDGRNPQLRNRTLRRAISYAIDRRTILEEVVLKRAVDARNGPADGVFARDGYANAPDVRELDYDPLLARMLVGAARKEMGGDPIKLTYEYPSLPEARASAPRIVEALRLAGLLVTPIERPESELEEALRSGRRFDLAYRAGACNEPVAEAGPMLCPGYDAPQDTDGLAAIASPRILQLLLQIEYVSEFASARAAVAQLDREVRDELPVIPLWQLDHNYAWRTRLTGPKDVADALYQDIDQWEIAPWYAKDPW